MIKFVDKNVSLIILIYQEQNLSRAENEADGA